MQNTGSGKRTRASAAANDAGDFGAGGGIVALPGHDDVLPLRQRARQRFPRLAPHDHRVADGERAKALEVLGEAPWQPVTGADDAVRRDGGDQRDGVGDGARAFSLP